MTLPVISVFRVQGGKIVSSWQITDERAVADQTVQIAK